MKKIIISLFAILAISTAVYAGFFSKLIFDNSRTTAAVTTQTSTALPLEYNSNVTYTFHAFGADSGVYFINTYGNIKNKYILLKRDTLKFGDDVNAGINYKTVTLRNASTDYLAGYNVIRFTVSSGAVPSADSTAAMGYLLQLVGR